MRKAFRIVARIIILPFVLLWQFADRDLWISWKAIIDWILLANYQDHSMKAELEREIGIQSKIR